MSQAHVMPRTETAPPTRSSKIDEALAVSIVIPVFNEGPNITYTLQAIEQHIHVPHETIIVYDMDDDSTVPVVRRLIAEGWRTALIKNIVARGPSGALRTGFAAAQGPKVLVVMGDGCDDLAPVDTLLKLVPEEVDVVCPSRYCRGGAQFLSGTPPVKAWIPRAAGRLLQWFSGIPTVDPTNSFKLYSARLLREVRLVSTVSFSVTLEIVAKAHCLGYRIVEVPTVWRDRTHGKSHFKIGRSVIAYFPWFCLALLRGRLIRMPMTWLRAWCGSPAVPVVEHPPLVQHA